MVWALGFNDGMGVTYSLMEMDGDIRKIAYVEGPADWGTLGGGFEPGERNLGRAWQPEHVPTGFQWGGPKNRHLPDVLYGPGLILVSDRFKDCVEQLEPGLHQFFPVDVIYKSNQQLARKMFILNICTRLDSVDRDLASCILESGLMWRPDKGGQLVFNLDQIGNHHLWHDKHIFNGWYVSDKLKSNLEAAGITGVVLNKRKTNVEWP